MLEVAEATIAAIGKDKVGIRLSPFGVFNDMPIYPEMEADYAYLAQKLNALGLVYVHLVDHSSMGAPAVPESIKATFRKEFKRTLILSGGYDAARAEADLEAGKCDLIAVGQPFLANPDLVERWKTGAPVNAPDMSTFYTPGPKGYTDYHYFGRFLSGTGFPNQFFCNSWVVGFWRGRPWLAEFRIGGRSLDAFSSRFWLGWVTRRGDKCVHSTFRG